MFSQNFSVQKLQNCKIAKFNYFFITCSLFLMMSCSKQSEEMPAPQEKTDKGSNLKSRNPYDQITIQHGMLVFTDSTHLQRVIDKLDQEYQTWNSNFVNQWNHLDYGAFEAKIEELKFDEDKPLKDFEKRFNIASVRAKISSEEETWLNNEILTGLSPEHNYFTFEEAEQTIWNANQEYKVGNAIFVAKGADLLYEITDGRFSTLDSLRKGYSTTGKGNVKEYFEKSASFCSRYKRNDDEVNYLSDKKYERMIKIWGRDTKIKLKSFKKKGRRWKRHYNNLRIRVYGEVSYTDCVSYEIFDSNTISSNHAWKLKYKYYFPYRPAKTSSGKIKGDYFCNNHQSTRALTW